MNAHQVLATVAVSDFAASSAWYARLFGRAPDHSPNASCVEWQIAKCTRIQVLPRNDLVDQLSRAGCASLGIMVADLDEVLVELQGRQIDVAPQAATHFVRFAPVSDPDGNLVTFVESIAG
ncbi:VOC family protein [Rhodanobacter glycinis]|uniref:VOC family protein n=1 Tax=Rhodanobacter glycinis TaxID=582702 RepID=A0A502FM15_9GAMM|nr:VOC family protein [Rhodanobacter glycinis]TPG08215.1 VOC family protein [Rhodanobacter glycinis]TPG50093.1 VOC family protein [Rhodanobacter glycinis]